MNNLLMWVAGLLVAAFAALFAVPPLVDWNQFRGVFEEEASRLLGREVRVGGAVNLRILPVPYVSFEKVSISDAPGLSGAFLKAERFTMLLSAPPLLRGVMEARQLEIESPEIRLRFDQNGGGNWQQLKIREGELAFVPTDVSLQSAMIRNGRIVLLANDENRIATLDQVTGELSAKGLRGPYKFNGSLNIDKNEHALRLSTASMDANGLLRFKLSAQSSSTRTQHRIDGQIQDLGAAPRITGKLEARGPVRLDAEQEADKPAFYDLRAQLNLDTTVAELGDLSVSFDSAGRPQLLVGAARATWDGGLRVSSKLSSKWLDLDTMSSGKTTQAPAKALAFLAGNVLDTGPRGQSRLDLELDQVSLGSEVVRRLNIRLIENAGQARVDHISALLPGRTRLRANGQIVMLKHGLGGGGQLLLNGRSLEKFLGWLKLDAGELKGRAAGAFEYSSDVAVKSKKVTITNARMRFATGDSRGSFEFDWSGKPRIKLQADGNQMDMSSLGSRLLAPESIAYILGVGDQSDGKKRSPALQFLSSYDLDLDLNVRSMTDGEQELSDVGIRMSRTGKSIRFARSRLTFEPGLSLEIEGDVNGGKAGAVWKLTGLVDADSPRALEKLHRLVGSLVAQKERPRFLRTAAPLTAAFVTKAINADGKWNSVLSLDGTLGTDRLRVLIDSAGPPANWRNNPIQADLKIDGYAEKALVKLLNWELQDQTGASVSTPKSANGSGQPGPSLFRLKLSGTPSKALKASAALAGDSWQLRLRGSGEPSTTDQSFNWKGAGWLQAGDVAQAISSAAPRWLQLVRTSGGVEGDFHFSGQAGKWTVEPIQVRSGPSTVSGQLDLLAASGKRQRPKVSGRLELSEIDALPVYLALLKGDRPLGQTSVDEAETNNEPRPLWPDSPFNLASMQLFDADIQIGAARLKLAPAVILSDVSSKLVVASGNVDLQIHKGRLFNGELTGSGKLQPEQAGAKVALDFSLKNARLKRLTSVGVLAQKLGGRADIELKASGQALSPRALAIALSGNGTAKVRQARVPGLAPIQLSKAADRVVLAEADAEDLGNEIDVLVTAGAVNIGNQSMKLTVRDGTMTVSPFKVSTQESGLASNRTTIDIVRGIIDSRWEIPTKLQRAIAAGVDPRKPLPPVRITYGGVLGALATIAPQVSIGDLQRELTVQRMENDVRRLERQRQEDERRAKAEAERLKQLELERLEALEEERRKRELNLQQPAVAPVNPDENPIPGQLQEGQQGIFQGSGQPSSNGGTGTVERQPLPPIAPQGSDSNGQVNGAQGANLQPSLNSQGEVAGPPLPAVAPPKPRRIRKRRSTKKVDPFNADNN